MKVATKIAASFGLVVFLLLAVVAWDVSLVARLAEATQALSRINFRTSGIVLRQARTLNQLDEFTRKLEVTGDSAYAERLGELRRAFAKDLAELRSLDHSARVRAEVVALAEEWDAYWRQMSDYQQVRAATSGAGLADLDSSLERLRQRLDRVGAAAQLSVTGQAFSSLEVSGRAWRVSWAIAASATLLCLMIMWLTVRSIKRPLKQLAEGTRAVASGEFSVRLDARGEDEFSRLASSFNQMVEQLGEAERAKKDFLSHVSHELRTPLASMQETNELLLEEIPGPLNKKQMRFLTLNLDSSRRLSSMITKLLDLSRMEARAMDYDFRRHDLVALARTVVAGFEARARDMAVRLVLQAPAGEVVVECDRDRLIQVLENLIDNALNFSPKGTAVEVRVFPPGTRPAGGPGPSPGRRVVSEIRENSVIVEVADAGPGIPDQQKSLVFDRFHRVAGAQRDTTRRGVGLGLAICREIMDAHRGTVTVRDNEKRGSVFTVVLPALDPAKAAARDAVADGDRRQSVGA